MKKGLASIVMIGLTITGGIIGNHHNKAAIGLGVGYLLGIFSLMSICWRRT